MAARLKTCIHWWNLLMCLFKHFAYSSFFQSSEELHLSVAHIKQIIGILRDFIRSPEHRVMASTISKLKIELDFDSTSINQIHLVLFGFQDAVCSSECNIWGWGEGPTTNNTFCCYLNLKP